MFNIQDTYDEVARSTATVIESTLAREMGDDFSPSIICLGGVSFNKIATEGGVETLGAVLGRTLTMVARHELSDHVFGRPLVVPDRTNEMYRVFIPAIPRSMLREDVVKS